MSQANTQTDEPVRIALYGGAFDPVHNAHVAIAEAAVQQADLTQLIWIPAAQSPLKAHAPIASDAERIEMLLLATGHRPEFSVDRSEIEKGGSSYTIDTVRHFTREYPGAELFWIIGGDQLAQLDRWAEIDQLTQLVTFLVVARPDSGQASALPGLVSRELEAPMMEESSTTIRQRIARGQSISEMVPPKVAAFIDRRKLYQPQ